VKIRLTENQYKNLVEQINLKNLSREAQKLIKYWDQIDWNKVDSLALKKLTPEHHGVDLDTTGDVKNQPVVATCLGEVLRSEYGVAACGGMVLLGCYDGTQVQYCHLDFVIPKDTIVGQIVPQGFPLGVSGGDSPEYDKAGRSGGPHLHYALWNPYPNKSINPHIAYPNLFPSDKGSKQPPTMNR